MMATGPLDPNLRNYLETAKALQNEEIDFIRKEINAEGRLVDKPRTGLLHSLRLRLCSSSPRAREALINQFVKQYREKVEVLLHASARINKDDLSNQSRLLARIERALNSTAVVAPAPLPAPRSIAPHHVAPPTAVPLAPTVPVAEPAPVAPPAVAPPEPIASTVPTPAPAVPPSEVSPKIIDEERDKASAALKRDAMIQDKRWARAEKMLSGSPPPAATARPEPAEKPPAPALAEPSFKRYKNLPKEIQGVIIAGSDHHTAGAVAATERAARVSTEPVYHEACALFSFCWELPAAKEYVDKLSDDKKAIIQQLKEGNYEKLTAKQKQEVIAMAQELEKIVRNQDLSDVVRINAAFPVRVMPNNIATLFPNLRTLEFEADKLYKKVNLPQLNVLIVKGIEGDEINMIQAGNLVELHIDGLKKMPNLTGFPLLKTMSIKYGSFEKIEVEHLPKSLTALYLRGNEQLSHIRLALPNLTSLSITSVSQKSPADLELDTPELQNFVYNESRLVKLPKTLFLCSKLRSLNLNRTQIRHLPIRLRYLTQLKSIQLADVPLDHFPPALGYLPELENAFLHFDPPVPAPLWLTHFPPKLKMLNINGQWYQLNREPPARSS